ncbi:MAG TPA: PQQ-dependent sugar dehydrogenase [Coriobacteriia bacterium]|nr:PQQ-dependent sugar dehydrogenase [Coriobacteriia bacterium]
MRLALRAAIATCGIVAAVVLLAACTPSEPVVVDGTPPSRPATPTPAPEPVWPPTIRLKPAFSGFEQPVLAIGARDGSGRLYVVELTGRIRVVKADTVLPEPFLDLSGLVSTGGERGLFSVAFPLDYGASGVFYVDYTNAEGHSVIARYRVSEDPDRADPASAEVLLTVEQPYANHNGGQLAFGPDGFLYIGFGDGGSGGDPEDNAQNPATLLGKILRLDVSRPGAYGIPADNPPIGQTAYRPEIWALGLRNPWRFSFDRETGDLYIADVGQNAWEEINVEPVGSGGRNYGWNLFEGTHPYPPEAAHESTGFAMPVIEYSHDAGQSITGGFVYRGLEFPSLEGLYFYADFSSGRLWALRRAGDGWQTALVAETGLSLAGFGQDDSGEVYVLDMQGGEMLRITAGEPASP